MEYGKKPETIGEFDLAFEEYMHYMYLPIAIQDVGEDMPRNLWFASPLIMEAVESELARGNGWDYVYVTARRGYATPGNPLNRPGWHSDGFGTEDINYVWTDRYPTLFAEGTFYDISDDHVLSAQQFSKQILDSEVLGNVDGSSPINVVTYPDKMLQRLDASVIHAAPEIPAPGGERSFFKVSFSNSRYNLKGNAHNYLLDYDWEMFERNSVRNDPSRAGKDAA